jgi:hypothetical protein
MTHQKSVRALVILAALVVLPLAGYMYLGNLRGTVTSPPACPSRSFTSCQEVPNAGTLAGCSPGQYCGLGFGMTGFICKCKGTASSLSLSSGAMSSVISSNAASGPFCCQAFAPPAPPYVCIVAGPGRCGAPASVQTYSTSNCGGVCPAAVASSAGA